MIIYSPIDGDALTSLVPTKLRHCFLMTRLGKPIAPGVREIREGVTRLCNEIDYDVIDASSQVTGRDFLLKIWKLIALSPLSAGICHEETAPETQANIYYELS